MDEAMSKLRDAFLERFKGSEVLFRSYSGDAFGGWLIWSGFVGLDHLDRQRLLRNVVRETLDEEGQDRASMIVGLTPEESPALTDPQTF